MKLSNLLHGSNSHPHEKMSACMTLHSTGKSGYIGRLSIPETIHHAFFKNPKESKTKHKPQVFFILDRSGSMGQWVGRMVNIVIPQIADQCLGMSPADKLTLITFDSQSCTEKIETTVKQLEKMEIRARGTTYMSGVFSHLLGSIDKTNRNIQIVAISDGEVWDQENTLAQARLAAAQLKGSYSVAATAIRLLTSSSQPDTRALASVLQLNTSTPGSIVDVLAKEAHHLKGIVDTLCSSDCFSSTQTAAFSLKADNKCIRHNPWSSAASEVQFNLPKESSSISFWIDEPPSNVKVNGVSIDVERGEPVTMETLSFLLGDKLKYFLSQLRVLMVINSQEAKEELHKIVTYFKDMEDNLPPSKDLKPLLADGTLKGRLQYTMKSVSRQMKSVSLAMQSIANDEKVETLNLAQQADYLRQTGSSKSSTTRNFAKRAIECGIDFDSVMRSEILSMLAHADELKEIDDSGHTVSFYSQATTLDGIKCMLELANEPDVLNQLAAHQILRLFNIVGIPAVGPVGDFPDPMSYRLTKFLPGSYISIADLTMAWNQGGVLTAPGGKKEEIITSIPIFEDDRVQRFLQKYARSSLEYMSSIGMRKMIAEVPKTYPYTICAGLWKMVEELDNNKTELGIKHFIQLTRTYEQASTGLFDHIIPLLQEEQDIKQSYNLGHNGITNMLGPILSLVRTGQTENLSRIMRALYSFETYQVMRRLFRDDGLEGRAKALDEILGVDFSSDQATPLPALFTRSEPEHCSRAILNVESLRKYTKALWFVHYVTLVPKFFGALVNATGDDDCVNRIKSMTKMSDSSISTALELQSGISLDDFLFFNVIEGILYSTKQERVNKETDKPLLKDLGNANVGSNMIAEYVRSRYTEDYDTRLRQQLGEEKSILRAELIDNLLQSADMETFVSLLAAGNKRGVVSIALDRDNSAGFERLHKELLDDTTEVPKRVEKLRVIYTGRTRSGDDVFNGGNLLRTDWKPLGELLTRLGEIDEWDRLQQELSTRGHLYRGGADVANRHGHSNDLPSYFAFGCMSLEDYHKMVTTETWSSYIQEHCNCCGVADFLAEMNAAALR